ncbi:MAG: RNA-binding transcriptional accessory protein, partial [Lachnospiraceae bacterium]|nr:RNA-binding transcriptional accessory protein [Lachnospiraceae bacterium]
MDILKVISDELNIKLSQVEATVKLIDEGNTIPFIARYRKEVTGSLNDEVLRNLDERLKYLRNLEDRKATVLASIEDQGKLTDELRKQIEEAATLVLVEDLYRPYKQKKRTRAIIAKEKGLEPLANIITLQMTTKPLEEEAISYISEEKGVADEKEAIAGTLDIIAEAISDEADYRTYIRKRTIKEGMLTSTAKDEEVQS